MTALIEPTTPWLREINRFVDRETRDRLDVELMNDIVTVRGERPYPYGGDVPRLPKPEARKPRRIDVRAGEHGSA